MAIRKKVETVARQLYELESMLRQASNLAHSISKTMPHLEGEMRKFDELDPGSPLTGCTKSLALMKTVGASQEADRPDSVYAQRGNDVLRVEPILMSAEHVFRARVPRAVKTVARKEIDVGPECEWSFSASEEARAIALLNRNIWRRDARARLETIQRSLFPDLYVSISHDISAARNKNRVENFLYQVARMTSDAMILAVSPDGEYRAFTMLREQPALEGDRDFLICADVLNDAACVFIGGIAVDAWKLVEGQEKRVEAFLENR